MFFFILLNGNPQQKVEKRAHRIGQDKNVMIYKLYYSNTIEEFMRDKVDSKRIMSKL